MSVFGCVPVVRVVTLWCRDVLGRDVVGVGPPVVVCCMLQLTRVVLDVLVVCCCVSPVLYCCCFC